MRDESSMFRHTMWMSYITRSGISCWFRIYNWLTGFHQDIVMTFQKNYFSTCLHQNFCLLVLAGSALQPVNKDRIYFCLCLLVEVHSYSHAPMSKHGMPSKQSHLTCLQNKQQNCVKYRLPATPWPFMWLVVLKLLLHGVAPKLEEEKFGCIFEIFIYGFKLQRKPTIYS